MLEDAKSCFVVIGSQKSRTEILKEAADNPIMMGDMIIENSKSEKYLGDQIHEDGCAASITATMDWRISIAIERGDTQSLKSIGSMGAPLPRRDTFARKVGLISKENNTFLMYKD